MTAFLMFVIMAVATDTRAIGAAAAIAIGGVIGLDALFGGPVTGASMNPARSFGPALVSGEWRAFWAYLAGPIAGATIGALAYQSIRGEHSAERVPPVEVVRSVRTDQHDRCRAQTASEIREQLACRAVGPMEIFEHEQGRYALGQPLEQAEQLLEQRTGHDAFARRRVDLGEQRGELVASRPDYLGEQPVRAYMSYFDSCPRIAPEGKSVVCTFT